MIRGRGLMRNEIVYRRNPYRTWISMWSQWWLVIPLCSFLMMPHAAVASVTNKKVVRGFSTKVYRDRVYLSDIVRGYRGEWGSLDLGPAPSPGKVRVINRAEVKRFLGKAQISHPRLNIPTVVRVKRPAQVMNAIELRSRLERVMREKLPPSIGFHKIRVGRGVMLPMGEIKIDIGRITMRQGSQVMKAQIGVYEAKPHRQKLALHNRDEAPSYTIQMPFQIELSMIGMNANKILKRGDEVEVTARKGTIFMRLKGVVQKDGALGDVVPVLSRSSRSILDARVVSSTRVEVEL